MDEVIAGVISSIDDIVASPVIVGRNVYAADGSGKVVSLKIENGERNWTAPFGSAVISGLQVSLYFLFR